LGSRRSTFFDQFSIKFGEGFTDLDFQDRRASSGLVVRVANDVLKRNRQDFLKYLGECGQPETQAPAPVHVSAPQTIVFADFIGLARHGELGEVIFHAVSWKIAVDRTRQSPDTKTIVKDQPVVPSLCVALLRSSLDAHKHWVAALYAKS
jgi:hypothetical protein